MGSKISIHLAIWGLRLAVFAPIIMLISGGVYRARFVDFQIPLVAFTIAVVLAILAALFGGTKTQASGPTGPMTVVSAALVASAIDLTGSLDSAMGIIILSFLYF